MFDFADRERSYVAHVIKNASLILLSICFLPLTTPIFLILTVLSAWTSPSTRAAHGGNTPHDASCKGGTITVLITGVSMQKGLTLARLFYLHGISRPDGPRVRVIGADFSRLAMGAVSRSLSRFYKLTPPNNGDDEPYVESLLHVIHREKVDLWVSCSGVASAVEDGVARDAVTRVTGGACKCVQFGEVDTAMLHEKGNFMRAVTEAGLSVPETHVVRHRGEVASLLAEHYGTGKKFILKPLGVVDKYRADMTRLPLATRAETQKHIARIPIAQDDPFILQEFVDGKEYCTHAVVLRGKVVAFVACESASVLMHYVALPEQSPLTRAMFRFTTRMAEWAQERAYGRADGSEFTGHMSFDFLVRKGDDDKRDGDVDIWPIECNPRTHTAVVLFDGEGGLEMIEPYIRYVQGNGSLPNGTISKGNFPDLNGQQDHTTVYGSASRSYYWLPHDLVAFAILPIFRAIVPRGSSEVENPDPVTRRLLAAAHSLQTFFLHVQGPKWKDASLEYWDPLPAWWLWHIYWPFKFLDSLWQGFRWSEVNVSTGKVFGC